MHIRDLVAWLEAEHAASAPAPDEPRPPIERSPVPAAGAGDATLEEAWRRLGLAGTLDLLHRFADGGWVRAAGDRRLEGPCPAKRGNCKDDPRAAYAYPRVDGGPWFVHCSHRNSCGAVVSVFDLVADATGGSRDRAARELKAAAGFLVDLGPDPTPDDLARAVDGPQAHVISVCPRAVIPLTDNVRGMAEAVETVLAGHPDLHVYSQGRSLSRVVRGPTGIRIDPLPLPWLNALVSGVCQFTRPGKPGPDGEPRTVAVLPPRMVVEALASKGIWQFDELEGVSGVPTMLPDGTVVDEPGYHAGSRMFYSPDVEFPPVPASPEWDDARAALALLKVPLAEFPFRDKCSGLSAALAMVLTGVGRVAIAGPTPLFMVRASTPGSGKNLLADVAAIIATGQIAPRLEAAHSDEEWRKQITTAVMTGAGFVVLDEAEKLASRALASALTSEFWTDRVLGSNREVRARRPVFASCGNNTMLGGDIGRRVVPIELQVEGVHAERPEERTGFAIGDLARWCRDNRPRLVTAALTVLRAYFVAGRPAVDLAPYGSFEAWSDLVRSALVWAGEADPCAGRAAVREEADSAWDDLRLLLTVLSTTLADESMTTGEILTAAARDPELAEALAAIGQNKLGQLDTRRVAYGLRRLKGRVISGLRLESGEPRRGMSTWRVVCTTSPAIVAQPVPNQ